MAIDSNGLSSLDATQVIRGTATITADGELVQKTVNIAVLVPETYDYIALTYVAAGNGAGEIETAAYKTGGAGGNGSGSGQSPLAYQTTAGAGGDGGDGYVAIYYIS